MKAIKTLIILLMLLLMLNGVEACLCTSDAAQGPCLAAWPTEECHKIVDNYVYDIKVIVDSDDQVTEPDDNTEVTIPPEAADTVKIQLADNPCRETDQLILVFNNQGEWETIQAEMQVGEEVSFTTSLSSIPADAVKTVGNEKYVYLAVMEGPECEWTGCKDKNGIMLSPIVTDNKFKAGTTIKFYACNPTYGCDVSEDNQCDPNCLPSWL